VKWVFALEFQLSKTAKIIIERVKKFDDEIQILDIGESLSFFYNALSETISHDRSPRPITLNEMEWKAVFDRSRISDPAAQAVIREVVYDL
jgi:hypothetical protein